MLNFRFLHSYFSFRDSRSAIFMYVGLGAVYTYIAAHLGVLAGICFSRAFRAVVEMWIDPSFFDELFAPSNIKKLVAFHAFMLNTHSE